MLYINCNGASISYADILSIGLLHIALSGVLLIPGYIFYWPPTTWDFSSYAFYIIAAICALILIFEITLLYQLHKEANSN